jgi:hypothetical protein
MTINSTQTIRSPFSAPWRLRFERDGTEDVAVICDADGAELIRSRHFWLPAAGDPEPPTLAAIRLIQAAPALLKVLTRCADLLADYDEAPGEEGDAYRDVLAAIALANHTPLPASSPIKLSEEEFDDRFPLLINHLNPNASWGTGNEGGCLFETYGDELEFVRGQDPLTIWTLVDGDHRDQYLLSGFHFVNRIGYLVSSVALPEGVEFEVRIPMGDPGDGPPDDAGEA